MDTDSPAFCHPEQVRMIASRSEYISSDDM